MIGVVPKWRPMTIYEVSPFWLGEFFFKPMKSMPEPLILAVRPLTLSLL
jgi:hypothetical protein